MSESPPPLPQSLPQDIRDDAGMRMLLPVGRSGWAIAAGYLGLFAVLVLPAPIALIVSIVAIRDIQKSKTSQQRKYGMGRAVFGLVMGALFTPLLIVMLFVMAFAP